MSEYLKCPLCGYSHWDIVAMQEEQNALIAAALERARKGEA